MGKPHDYNPHALNYSKTRFAQKWVLDSLFALVKKCSISSSILEIGCGTGNYIIALSELSKEHKYFGFDLSAEMLKVAKSLSDKITFTRIDAEKNFPYKSRTFDFCFAVDVIHHIVNIQNFFDETFRCLKHNCSFALVTDLEENMRKRSLSKFFPEILQVELDRYPSLNVIKNSAINSGFVLDSMELAEGFVDISDDYIEKVKSKFSSSMRLISDEAHKKGIERLQNAKEKGEKWFSSYSVLAFKK